MPIFEQPYFIILLIVVCFVALAAVGFLFAARGVKVANGREENDFTTISKVEAAFKKWGKQAMDRCLLYISVSSDISLGASSESVILFALRRVLLETLADGEGTVIAPCDNKNFVLLLNQTEEIARQNVERCQAEIGKCLVQYSALNVVNVRIGSYFAVGTDVTFDEAISRAKQACTMAANEKSAYAEWNVGSGKTLETKIKIENNIESEIDNNRFFLEYQPVLDARTKKIIGAEVLSRLNSETDGIVTPNVFLSAVDSVGINEKFDYYIFEKNCKWISNDKPQREGYKYTINFSRSTLSEPSFAEKIIGIAEKYDLKLSCLAVEILEDKDLTGEAKQQMTDNLSMLKEKGISVLLDDFGSGYTTFGDLQNLDISIVKIDKSITQNAVTETGFIILKNLIRTSQDIGFKTLCEGIETKEQEEAAIRAGCDLLQGFYYYRPMPVAMLEKLFDTTL